MKELIEKFPEQLRKAVAIAEAVKLSDTKHEIKNVLIAGLGGSGIGGTIATEINMLECKVPITVTKGYFMPEFVNENTLVIISSYSGNTEETINVMNLAIERKAHVVSITSGGFIADTAKTKNLDLVILPAGMPPRTCLGYSLVQVLNVLYQLALIKKNPLPKILSSAELLVSENESIHQEAKIISSFFKGKIPVLYSTTFHEGIAIRWRQQINENSKMLCWHHVVPEMNHNELVGWRNKNENLAVLYLLFNNEYERNLKRIEMNKDVIKQYTSNIHTLIAKGNNEIEQTFYLNAIGDWVSYYLSLENGVEAAEINVINHLKNQLSKF
jgi:glucose/mannose-6-phosphate isomerase